jgi:beta-lactamase regulating signal transducer with metallopeptidase domain
MPMIDSMEYVVTLLWRVSWQASLLVLLVLLAQGLMRQRLSPSWRSALWLLVVVRLLLPVTPSSGWSLFNLTGGRVVPATSASNGIGWGDAGEGTGLAAAEAARLEVGPWWSAAMEDRVEHFGDAWAAQRGPVPSSDWAVESVEAVKSVGSAARPFHWMAILFWVWLAGILVLGLRVGGSAVMLTRRIRQEPPVTNPEVLAMFVECRRDMGTGVPVTLVETSEVDSPALFGFWRLNLLLPPQTLRRLSGAELRHVFLHELAHVRRGDVILNWLATLIQIVHWFNPVIWFALARMRADREIACDALALERDASMDRTAYGTTILKLVSGLGSARPAPGLVGISEGRSNLKRRIRMIAIPRQPRRGSRLAAMLLIALGLVSLTDAPTVQGVEELGSMAGEVASDEKLPMAPEADADRVSEMLADPLQDVESAVGGKDDGIRRIEAAKHDQPAQLETRIFRINPNTFVNGLRGVGTLPTLDAKPNATGNPDDHPRASPGRDQPTPRLRCGVQAIS